MALIQHVLVAQVMMRTIQGSRCISSFFRLILWKPSKHNSTLETFIDNEINEVICLNMTLHMYIHNCKNDYIQLRNAWAPISSTIKTLMLADVLSRRFEIEII